MTWGLLFIGFIVGVLVGIAVKWWDDKDTD